MADDLGTAFKALDQAQAAFEKAGTSRAAWSQPWTPELVKFLAVSVLAFSCVALVLSAVLLWRNHANAQQILKVFGVTTIVGFSALLLIVGYNNDQLTPIIGLFGAIAGYLLGKDSKEPEK